MNRIFPIRNEEDEDRALQLLDVLWGSPHGTPDGDVLDVLLALLVDYQERHYPVPGGDPIEVIRYKMGELGLSVEELAERMRTDLPHLAGLLERKSPLLLREALQMGRALGLNPRILMGAEKAHCEKYPHAVDLTEFIDMGFLQEANRQFFHPLGLAMGVSTSSKDVVILDYRSEPEGVLFSQEVVRGTSAQDKADRVEELRKSKIPLRVCTGECNSQGIQALSQGSDFPGGVIGK